MVNLKPIIKFLTDNGFKQLSDNSFTNNECQVDILESSYYCVNFKDDTEECSMYSQTLNIYWLVGVLTWYNLIDKNFKI